jgi:hypothetical protein
VAAAGPANEETRAVNALVTNSGQICFAATRVFVQSKIYDKFVAAYVERLKAKKEVLGDPEAPGTEIGPVVDKTQYDRIMGIISSAKENNDGKVLTGGQRVGEKASDVVVGRIELGPELTETGILYRTHRFCRDRQDILHLQGRDLWTSRCYQQVRHGGRNPRVSQRQQVRTHGRGLHSGYQPGASFELAD